MKLHEILHPIRTRRVKREQAKSKRLGKAYKVKFSEEVHPGITRGSYAALQMERVNPERRLS